LALEAFCDTGGRQAALIKASGIPEGSFARTVSALIRDGFATQDAKGEPYRITEAGHKKLSELS
jgi:DNA-binding IclR family transcriptional regulator